MPVTANFRDLTITNLTGSSQTLAPQNGSRNFLFISNTGTANIGVNLVGGTAAIGGAGTVTLVPPGTQGTNALQFENVVPQNLITVIGTAGQKVACVEA